MWIFTRYGFYSVATAQGADAAEAAGSSKRVMIRARSRSHLQNLQHRFGALSGLEILKWPHRDYRFRIIADKDVWDSIVREIANEQTWSNFKNEVANCLSGDQAYIHALHEVWGVMRRLQEPMAKSSSTPAESRTEVSTSVLDEVPPPDLYWDGITKPETLTREGLTLRQDLANRAKNYDWPEVLSILSEHPDLINTTRPGGCSLYAPLHQAAHGGAGIEVVTRLLRLGAWRTLRNADGDRPADVARKKSHTHLQEILEPTYCQGVPPAVLGRIQDHFHAVIRVRAIDLVREHSLRLPELEVVLEFRPRKFWFAVPGMCGGFAYWLAYDGPNAKLVCESWCRVVQGSDQRHEVTADGSRLVDQGFA